MNTFCPFFKDICRGNECVMFKNEECLIVTFLQNISEESPQSEGIIETNEFEMQQEIDVHLRIDNNEEHGSLIHESWTN